MLSRGPSSLGQGGGGVALKPAAYGPWAYTVFREMTMFFCVFCIYTLLSS